MNLSQRQFIAYKSLTYLFMLVACSLEPFLKIYFSTSSSGHIYKKFIISFLFLVPFSVWYSLDSLEFSNELNKKRRYLFVLLGIFILPFHFYKTRGLSGIPKFILFIFLIALSSSTGLSLGEYFTTNN